MTRVHFDLDYTSDEHELSSAIARVICSLSESSALPQSLYLQAFSKAKAKNNPIDATSVHKVEQAIFKQLEVREFPYLAAAAFWSENSEGKSFLISSAFTENMECPHFVNLKFDVGLKDQFLATGRTLLGIPRVSLVAVSEKQNLNHGFFVFDRRMSWLKGMEAKERYEELYRFEAKAKRQRRGKKGF